MTGTHSKALAPGLYVVATPIGNLGDFSQRAQDVLSQVDLVLAEDTRHSKRLLEHFGITAQLRSCHEHNEAEQSAGVQQSIQEGKAIAIISDAGTPLISDPGYVLVRDLRAAGLAVFSVPGPSSIIAALSISGLPTDSFLFDGFLPSKSAARQARFRDFLSQQHTIVVLESSHRILASLRDALEVLGDKRHLVIAREISKKFETVLSGSARQLIAALEQDSDQQRGEFVMMIAGAEKQGTSATEMDATLTVLLSELPVKQAATLTAKLLDLRKNEVYKRALELNSDD